MDHGAALDRAPRDVVEGDGSEGRVVCGRQEVEVDVSVRLQLVCADRPERRVQRPVEVLERVGTSLLSLSKSYELKPIKINYFKQNTLIDLKNKHKKKILQDNIKEAHKIKIKL